MVHRGVAILLLGIGFVLIDTGSCLKCITCEDCKAFDKEKHKSEECVKVEATTAAAPSEGAKRRAAGTFKCITNTLDDGKVDRMCKEGGCNKDTDKNCKDCEEDDCNSAIHIKVFRPLLTLAVIVSCLYYK